MAASEYPNWIYFKGQRTGTGNVTDWERLAGGWLLPSDYSSLATQMRLQIEDADTGELRELGWYRVNGDQLERVSVIQTSENDGLDSENPPQPISFSGPVLVGSTIGGDDFLSIGYNGSVRYVDALRTALYRNSIQDVQADTTLPNGAIIVAVTGTYIPDGGGDATGATRPGVILKLDTDGGTVDDRTVYDHPSGVLRVQRVGLQANFIEKVVDDFSGQVALNDGEASFVLGDYTGSDITAAQALGTLLAGLWVQDDASALAVGPDVKAPPSGPGRRRRVPLKTTFTTGLEILDSDTTAVLDVATLYNAQITLNVATLDGAHEIEAVVSVGPATGAGSDQPPDTSTIVVDIVRRRGTALTIADGDTGTEIRLKNLTDSDLGDALLSLGRAR